MLVSSVRIILYNRLIRFYHLEGRKSGLRKWQTKSESCCLVCIQGVGNTEKGVTSLSFDSAVKTGPPRFPHPHTLGTDWRAPSAAAGFREIQMHGNLPIIVGRTPYFSGFTGSKRNDRIVY